MASASASLSRGGTRMPSASCRTTVRYPSIDVATTAVPEAIASRSTMPSVSNPVDGAQNTSAAR
jgi:hypothetical protein